MAQWIRHWPTEPGIAGSSPTGVRRVCDSSAGCGKSAAAWNMSPTSPFMTEQNVSCMPQAAYKQLLALAAPEPLQRTTAPSRAALELYVVRILRHLQKEFLHPPWHPCTYFSLPPAASEERTHDLRIMRPTRCQLRYRRSCTLLHSAFFLATGAMAQRQRV